MITAAQARRRYLLLLALRWFPVGLWIPVTVLLPLERGLTLSQAGLAAAVQGLVVFALELPTGGLADAWGRRPVLLLSGCFAVAALATMSVAGSLATFALVYLLMGVHRALDSGPLEAWFVDATLAADPAARLERGLGAGTAVLGVAIAAGCLTTGGLTAWVRVPGIEPLAFPVLVALGVTAAGLVAVAVLVREPARVHLPVLAAVRAVPAVIGDSLRLVRRSRVLAALIAVELFWGFGMVTFEKLLPVRLSAQVGGNEQAAALMGPAATAGWLASAAGAALIPLVSGRFGVASTAIVLRLAQGLAVVGMGLLAGPAGALTGFLLAYLVHGAANPLHTTLLHREVSGGQRSTVLSLNSMASQPAGSIGLITLTALAGATSISTAIVVGAVLLAAAAPLYLPARRAERRAADGSARLADGSARLADGSARLADGARSGGGVDQPIG